MLLLHRQDGARHRQDEVRRATSEAGLLRAPYPVGYNGDTGTASSRQARTWKSGDPLMF